MFNWLKSKRETGEQIAVADRPAPRYQDKFLVCQNCGDEFLFTSGEQEFFASVPQDRGGPLSEPKRCPACRTARRLAIGKTGGNGHDR